MAKFSVSVNNKFQFDTEVHGEEIHINGALSQADVSKLSSHTFHVLNENKSYNAALVSFDKDEKLIVIKVNNRLYRLNVEDEYSGLLKKMGIGGKSKIVAEVKAPMPGMVLQFFVQENVEVKKGDNLFVLEAMKMENMIKSPVDGIIKKLEVRVGDKVEKNQPIIQFQT